MKKILLCCFLFFIVAGSCNLVLAHDLFIWEVSHAGKPGKIYLGGTIHAGIPSLFPLDSKYDEILKKSDYLVLEIYENAIQKKISEARAAKHLIQYAMLPKGSKLEEMIPAKNFQQYRNYALQLNLLEKEWEGLQYFKPAILAVQLDTLGIRIIPNCSLDIGIDNLFKELFKHKNIRALETTMEQLKIITDMSDKEALLLLDYITGKSPEEVQHEMQMMFRSYLDGNTQIFLKDIEKTAQMIPDFYKALNADRNQKMAQKILQMLNEKENGLVMVGLAHLLGKDSLNTFLQKSGCVVKPIKAGGEKGCLTLLAACRLAPQFYRFQIADDNGKWLEDPNLSTSICRSFTTGNPADPDKVYAGKARKIKVTDVDGNTHYWGILPESKDKWVWFRWQDYSEKDQKIKGKVCYEISKWDFSPQSDPSQTAIKP